MRRANFTHHIPNLFYVSRLTYHVAGPSTFTVTVFAQPRLGGDERARLREQPGEPALAPGRLVDGRYALDSLLSRATDPT